MHPASSLTFERFDFLDAVEVAEVDGLQQLAMRTLESVTALSQVYTDRELQSIAENRRIMKVLVRDGAQLVGFGAMTNDLDGLVQFNARFFRQRFPEEAARDALYYAVAVIVDPSHWNRGVLNALTDTCAQTMEENGGEILLWDLVDFLHERQSEWLGARLSARYGVTISHDVIDTQRWMATRLPTVAEDVVVDLRND